MAAKLQRGNADEGDTNEAIALTGRAQEQLQRTSVAVSLSVPFSGSFCGSSIFIQSKHVK